MTTTMATTIGVSDEGVGHQINSTYYNRYVFTGLPRWWIRLFYGEKGLAKYFGGSGSSFVGVAYVSNSVRLSYPELVERLDSHGYKYRLDRRWRKKYVRDWRRRNGVIVVSVVDDVRCLVRVDRGYVRSVQVIGGIRSSDSLGRVASFLKDVFGITVSVRDLVSGVTTPKPDPNRLKSVSWDVIKRAKDSWIPVTWFGRWLSEKVVERLEPNSWIEVVSAPRVGKSSGVVLGLMRWVVEKNVDNYVVLVVVVNKRIGRQLYRYLLGGWKRLLKELRLLGWNAGMLAEKIRVRYYEGMGSSCLLGKEIHRFEDCLRCALFQLYQKEWRKVYRFPVPALDPVILRMSGFCPFQVLFSPVFWRNSFVILNYKLLPLVLSVLKRLNIKKVVVYFDEYLVHLNHRVGFVKVDLSKISRNVLDLEVEWNGKKVRFRDVVYRFNSLVDGLVKEVFMYYDSIGYEIYESANIGEKAFLGFVFLKYVGKVVSGGVDLSPIVSKVFNKFRDVVMLLEVFYGKYRLPLFRRIKRYIMFWFNSLYRVEFDGRMYKRVFAPEVGEVVFIVVLVVMFSLL